MKFKRNLGAAAWGKTKEEPVKPEPVIEEPVEEIEEKPAKKRREKK